MLLEIIHTRELSIDVLFMCAEMWSASIQSVRVNQDGKSITTRLDVSKRDIDNIEPEFLSDYWLGVDKIHVLEL